jgi:glycosyltransferase involved in cell wall biosynthesis
VSTILACCTLAFYEPFWNIARALRDDHGAEVTVIGPETVGVPVVYHPRGRVEARPSEPGLRTIALPLQDPANWWLGFRGHALARELRGLARPEAVWMEEEPHSGTAQQLLAAYFWRRPRPRIACGIVENIWSPPRRLRGLLYRVRISRIDHYLPCTLEAWTNFTAAYGVRDRTHEVAYFPTADCATPARSPHDGFVLGFAGRLCAEKGWRVLLDALADLPAEVTLQMAGGGPDEAEIRASVAARGLAGRVRLLGVVARSDLPAFYSGLDAFALPSLTLPRWKEQFGAVLAEAMSAGVPVVGSTSGGIPEAIGDAGLVVPEGDARALRDAIELLRTQPGQREVLARAGRRRFDERFSASAFARRVAALLAPRPPTAGGPHA